MINVAFYINNNAVADVDCTTIGGGNPGIGGTEYLFYYTSYGLQQQPNSNLKIVLLTASPCKLPDACIYIAVGDKMDAIKYCKDHGIEILVVKYEGADYVPNIFENVNDEIKIIVWAHNIIPNHILTILARTKSIKRIVNVGREQLDLYRDHLAFKKSSYIYNSVNMEAKEYYEQHSIPFADRKHEVAYLGSLVPIKGFHVLAKAWPDIMKACPDAHLNVIGSASVYGKAQLGKYGIAEESYEKEFMQYLTDSNGNILPSVTFYGKMGEEKSRILARCKVGVPNPSGYSETFCLSAVEMELYGCRIVTKKYVGFLDTVPPDAGHLYKNEKELAKNVVRELRITYNESQYDYCYANFNTEKILKQWYGVIEDVYNDRKPTIIKCTNFFYNYKFLREINRRIKSCLPFGSLMPTIDSYITLLRKMFPFLSIRNLY